MDADFSVKINDQKANLIAHRLVEQFPEGSVSADSLGNVCAYLAEYAGMSYSDTMTVLNRLSFTGSPADMLRLAYALIHFESTDKYPTCKCRVTAHGKIVKVTIDRMDSKNPQICLRFLLVSSVYAGCFVDAVIGIRDAIKLQRKIYSGRSKVLSGRSLLEFVGSLGTVTLYGDLVDHIDASTEEKRINKSLCKDRVAADTECVKAPSCVQCKERRNKCKLAVRY